MKEKIINKLSLIITILIVLLGVYLMYTLVTRINSKKEIKNNINEIFNDYEINDLKNIKIKIHSKTNYQSKITYNVELTSNKFDTLDYETQLEIIKYIKKISFKGNNKKYYINKVTIKTNENIYTYQNLFKKNNKLYETNNNYKEKYNEIKEKAKYKYNENKEKITN